MILDVILNGFSLVIYFILIFILSYGFLFGKKGTGFKRDLFVTGLMCIFCLYIMGVFK